MSAVEAETLAKVLREIIREVVKDEIKAAIEARRVAQPAATKPANGGTQPPAPGQRAPLPPMRICPKCGKKSVIKGKEEFGGGWVCWKGSKVVGCGSRFKTEAELEPDQVEPEPYEEEPVF